MVVVLGWLEVAWLGLVCFGWRCLEDMDGKVVSCCSELGPAHSQVGTKFLFDAKFLRTEIYWSPTYFGSNHFEARTLHMCKYLHLYAIMQEFRPKITLKGRPKRELEYGPAQPNLFSFYCKPLTLYIPVKK